jgi:hypothetical protein
VRLTRSGGPKSWKVLIFEALSSKQKPGVSSFTLRNISQWEVQVVVFSLNQYTNSGIELCLTIISTFQRCSIDSLVGSFLFEEVIGLLFSVLNT